MLCFHTAHSNLPRSILNIFLCLFVCACACVCAYTTHARKTGMVSQTDSAYSKNDVVSGILCISHENIFCMWCAELAHTHKHILSAVSGLRYAYRKLLFAYVHVRVFISRSTYRCRKRNTTHIPHLDACKY